MGYLGWDLHTWEFALRLVNLILSQITTLDPTLQKNLVASLELGLTNIGVDTVYTLCCDFIQVSETSYYI